MTDISSLDRLRSFGRVHIDQKIRPAVMRVWLNPLFHHARRLKPIPRVAYRLLLPAGAGGFALLTLIAWITGYRALGAALIIISMATTGLPVLIAPVFSADRVARQMLYQKQDPRRIDQMSPAEITSGLILANLWGLRWTIFGALVMAPALAIGLLRLDVLDFSAWHESALSLGSATDAGRASWLLPDGSIPYLRLLLRAMSAVVIPILLTGLFVALGVTVALAVNDPGLSPLLSLLMALPGGGLILGIWTMLTRIPLLGGILEILRALLILGLFAGMGAGIHVLNQQAAKHLRAPLTHKAIPTDSPSTPDDSTP